MAAAFGRLCVETLSLIAKTQNGTAAAFGRLCVETAAFGTDIAVLRKAAAFGRLCVETGQTFPQCLTE